MHGDDLKTLIVTGAVRPTASRKGGKVLRLERVSPAPRQEACRGQLHRSSGGCCVGYNVTATDSRKGRMTESRARTLRQSHRWLLCC